MFPSDTELHDAASNFIYCAMRSYVMALNVRAKKAASNGTRLITSGEFKRSHMMEFFEACNSLSK